MRLSNVKLIRKDYVNPSRLIIIMKMSVWSFAHDSLTIISTQETFILDFQVIHVEMFHRYYMHASLSYYMHASVPYYMHASLSHCMHASASYQVQFLADNKWKIAKGLIK